MKKIFQLIALFSLVSGFAFAQTRLPARQATVNTNNWSNLAPTNDTVQAVFDYIDAEGVGSGGYGTNTYVNPATWQYILETPSIPTGVVAEGFYLPGTNIVGATYDETNEQWTVDTQTDNFLPGTNIVGASYDTNTLSWDLSSSFAALSNKIPSSANSDTATYFLNSFDDSVTFITTNVFLVAPIFGQTTNELVSNGDFGSWDSGLERYTFNSPGLYNFSVEIYAYNDSTDGNAGTLTGTELNNFTMYWYLNGVTNDVKFTKPILNGAMYNYGNGNYRSVFENGDIRPTFQGSSYYTLNVSSGDYFRVMGQSYLNGYPTDPRVQITIPSLFITINRVYVP